MSNIELTIKMNLPGEDRETVISIEQGRLKELYKASKNMPKGSWLVCSVTFEYDLEVYMQISNRSVSFYATDHDTVHVMCDDTFTINDDLDLIQSLF